MDKTTKLIALIFLMVFITGISACGNFKSDDAKVRDMSETIIECFKNKDAETLKNMFCPIITDLENIDEQIKGAFDFIEGEIISYDIPPSHTMHKNRSDGITTMHYIGPTIYDVETDNGKKYQIWYEGFRVNVENENKIGFSQLRIKSDSDEEYKIGDYYLVNPEDKND